MSSHNQPLTDAWIGYEISEADIDAQPDVQLVKDQGVKRLQTGDYTLILKHLPSTDSSSAATAVKDLDETLTSGSITFKQYGSVQSADGHFVYLCLDTPGNNPPYISIGGKDPFDQPKTPQADLPHPFTVTGHLVLVGKRGEHVVKLYWSSEQGTFVCQTKASGKEPLPIHTIAIFPKVQIDTLVSVYLLKEFGEELFPGAKDAQIAFMSQAPAGKPPEQTEAEGTLLVDLGGRFDHHSANEASGKREESASTIIASYLEISDKKYLQKLLAWAKRDDLEGKGTISEDTLDRVFGLSGVISNLNRQLRKEPQKIIDLMLPLVHHHVAEQRHRIEGLPILWEKMQEDGTAKRWKLKQGNAEIKAAMISSDDIAFAGWLKAVKRIDLVVQRAPSGHTNVVTRQERSIDLRPLIGALRAAEAQALGVDATLDAEHLRSTGRIDEIPMWYYDDAANTLQNGGIEPGEIPATKLSVARVIDIINESLPSGTIGALKRRKQKELS